MNFFSCLGRTSLVRIHLLILKSAAEVWSLLPVSCFEFLRFELCHVTKFSGLGERRDQSLVRLHHVSLTDFCSWAYSFSSQHPNQHQGNLSKKPFLNYICWMVSSSFTLYIFRVWILFCSLTAFGYVKVKHIYVFHTSPLISPSHLSLTYPILLIRLTLLVFAVDVTQTRYRRTDSSTHSYSYSSFPATDLFSIKAEDIQTL